MYSGVAICAECDNCPGFEDNKTSHCGSCKHAQSSHIASPGGKYRTLEDVLGRLAEYAHDWQDAEDKSSSTPCLSEFWDRFSHWSALQCPLIQLVRKGEEDWMNECMASFLRRKPLRERCYRSGRSFSRNRDTTWEAAAFRILSAAVYRMMSRKLHTLNKPLSAKFSLFEQYVEEHDNWACTLSGASILYIYADPTLCDANFQYTADAVFYVGIGEPGRLLTHVQETLNSVGSNMKKEEKIRGLWRQKRGPICLCVLSGVERSVLEDFETLLVNKRCSPYANLVNRQKRQTSGMRDVSHFLTKESAESVERVVIEVWRRDVTGSAPHVRTDPHPMEIHDSFQGV